MEAAKGLASVVRLDDIFLSHCLADPKSAIWLEVLEHGDDDDVQNLEYIMDGTAQVEADLPDQVKRDIAQGSYHGGELKAGEYDDGHGGMQLNDFCNLAEAKMAGLKAHHVAVLRLYTSSSWLRSGRVLPTTFPVRDTAAVAAWAHQ